MPEEFIAPGCASGPNLPKSAGPFKVAALYKFADLFDFSALKAPLAEFCCARGIKGTLILAPEGINGTVAGTPQAVDALTAFLVDDPLFAGRLRGAAIKYSWAETMPFLRMKVREKPEIVTLRAPEADPTRQVGTYVAPKDWNALIARDDVLVIDTRNDYEVRLGSFAGALDPATKSFTQFKDFVADKLDPRHNGKVAMFCTGGIRCEKASAYLLAHGFSEVFQLQGGILAYLEQVPEAQSLWQGECFVFDERVSVTHGLAEGEAVLCRACRMPLTPQDRAHPAFRDGISCPHCADDSLKHAAAAERARQIALAERRGDAHLGDAARAGAERNRALVEARRARTRHKPKQVC